MNGDKIEAVRCGYKILGAAADDIGTGSLALQEPGQKPGQYTEPSAYSGEACSGH